MLRNIFSNRLFTVLFIFGLIVLMGCGLFYGRKVAKQEPVIIYKPVEVEKRPKPPPPGETFETGHWHGDEWHKGSHDAHAPAAETATPVDAPIAPVTTPEEQGAPIGAPIAQADFINPTSTSSNPLFADGVPEHLQCPPDLIGVYSVELEPGIRERMYQLTGEILEQWNPNRPLTEVYPAFIEVERWYHDNADPEQAGISMAANRMDWQLQLILDFPEIGVLAQEDLDRAFNMRRVELGDWSPDFNQFTLPDGSGRTFRTDDDKKYVFTWGAFRRETEGGFESSDGFVYTTGPSNGDPNAEVIEINLDEISDEELETLSGWNYHINPYTTGAYQLGDNK